MKGKLLIIAVVAMAALIMVFSACGNANKVDVAGEFLDKIETIADENSELTGYSMDSLSDAGDGLYAADAVVDGKRIGAISFGVEDDAVKVFAFCCNV